MTPELVLAHFVGDFLLQPKQMALSKSKDSWMCALHCLIYTLSLIWIGGVDFGHPVLLASLFVPHFVIDRWSLAHMWMRLTRNRDLVWAYNHRESIAEFYDAHFAALVYVVIDQTLHFLCLFVAIRLLA